MNGDEILRTYAKFYVLENDEFNFTKKIDMLSFIENADDGMIYDLFESGEIESPIILTEIADTWIIPGTGITYGDAKRALKGARDLKQSLVQKYQSAKGAVRDTIKSQIDKVNDKIDKFQDKLTIKPKVTKATEAPKKGFEKAVEGGKEMFQQAKEKTVEAGEKIVKAAGKAAEYAQQHPGKVATAAVIAAAALTAGVMAYRRFISKSNRACRNAEDKAACKQEFRNKGLRAQISALEAGKAKCFKSRNPGVCKSKIDVKISKINSKIKG